MSATVTSLAAHKAAKEKAKLAELDRAIMARAAHIAAHVDTVRLDPSSERVLRENLWELYL